MRKFLNTIAVLLLVTIVFSSCAVHLATLSTKKPEKIEKIALISTYFNQAIFSQVSIYSAAVNGKIRSISDELMLMYRDNIDHIRDTIAVTLQDELKCKVIYGDELHEIPGFKDLKAKYNFEDGLVTSSEYFPEIVYASNDLNPFEFTGGMIEAYFKKPDNYVNTISEICKKLNVKNIAISYSSLIAVPGNLYIPKTIVIGSDIYLFNSDGECIAAEPGVVQGIKFKSDEVDSFQKAMYQLPEALTMALRKIIKKNKDL
jgi:hypothetical protein